MQVNKFFLNCQINLLFNFFGKVKILLLLRYIITKNKRMDKVVLSIGEQVKNALDGRTQRWLSLAARIPEAELSKKINGEREFTSEEIKRINEVLKSKIRK